MRFKKSLKTLQIIENYHELRWILEKSSSPHSCLLIILIFAFILGGLIAVIGVVTGAEKENVMSKIDQFSAITPLILGWLYSCLTESSRFRATVGKLAVGVVVTDLEGN